MALIAVIAAICIAACGGSSNASTTTTKSSTNVSSTTTTASTAGANRFSALRTCLAKHGVKLPTRPGSYRRNFGTGTGTVPSGGTPPAAGGAPPAGAGGGYPGAGGGYPGAAGRGFFGGATSSKMRAALKACGANFGGNFRGGAGAAGGFRRTFSTATLDKFVACVRKNGYPQMPEPSKKTTSTGGLFPNSIRTNKKFEAAAAKCEGLLRASFGPPGGGAGGAAPGTATGTQTTSIG